MSVTFLYVSVTFRYVSPNTLDVFLSAKVTFDCVSPVSPPRSAFTQKAFPRVASGSGPSMVLLGGVPYVSLRFGYVWVRFERGISFRDLRGPGATRGYACYVSN